MDALLEKLFYVIDIYVVEIFEKGLALKSDKIKFGTYSHIYIQLNIVLDFVNIVLYVYYDYLNGNPANTSLSVSCNMKFFLLTCFIKISRRVLLHLKVI